MAASAPAATVSPTYASSLLALHTVLIIAADTPNNSHHSSTSSGHKESRQIPSSQLHLALRPSCKVNTSFTSAHKSCGSGGHRPLSTPVPMQAEVGAILSIVPLTIPDQRINFWGKCALGLEWEMSPQIHVCEYLAPSCWSCLGTSEGLWDMGPSYKVFRGGT